MFYLIHGQNRQKVAEKGFALAKGLILKKPDASYFKIDAENWSAEKIEELSGSQGLFENKFVVLLDNIWSDEIGTKDDIEKIKDSDNVFILIESGISTDNLKLLKKSAVKATEIAEGKLSKKVFNVFALSDALGEKNSKKLWMLYQEALFNNIEAEQIHGNLFWQVKNLILAKRGKLNGALKISPFVAQKARSYANKWQEKELEDLAENLVKIYHKARLGQGEMQVGLERLLLEI
jgi:DNA polymerase III delta subunit